MRLGHQHLKFGDDTRGSRYVSGGHIYDDPRVQDQADPALPDRPIISGSRNSSTSSLPPSRPRPDCLMPPNGAMGSGTSPRLRPSCRSSFSVTLSQGWRLPLIDRRLGHTGCLVGPGGDADRAESSAAIASSTVAEVTLVSTDSSAGLWTSKVCPPEVSFHRPSM